MNFSIFVACLVAIGMASPIHSFFFDEPHIDASVEVNYPSSCYIITRWLGLCEEPKSLPEPQPQPDVPTLAPKDERRDMLILLLNEMGRRYAALLYDYDEMIMSGEYTIGKNHLNCDTLDVVTGNVEEIKSKDKC